MDKGIIGALAGAFVFLSIVPYAWRTYQKKIQPQITTWSLWTLVGLTIALSCKDSGAGANIWPAVFGFTNPFIITVLAIRSREGREQLKLSRLDWVCVTISLTALFSWVILRNNPDLVQFVLYGAILASAVAAIPTLVSIRKDPNSDRPFAWALLGVGYGLAIFAINEPTLPNFVLPVYMVFGATWIVLTLTLHRVRNRIQIREWV